MCCVEGVGSSSRNIFGWFPVLKTVPVSVFDGEQLWFVYNLCCSSRDVKAHACFAKTILFNAFCNHRVQTVHARVTGVVFACTDAAVKICWPGELQHLICKSGFKPALNELAESDGTHPVWVHFGTVAGSVTLTSWLNQLQIALNLATCKEESGHRLMWPWCPGWSGRSSAHTAGSKCPLKWGHHRQLGAVTSADMDHESQLLFSWLTFVLKQVNKCADGGSVQVRPRDEDTQLMLSNEQLVGNSTQTVTDLFQKDTVLLI